MHAEVHQFDGTLGLGRTMGCEADDAIGTFTM